MYCVCYIVCMRYEVTINRNKKGGNMKDILFVVFVVGLIFWGSVNHMVKGDKFIQENMEVSR